MALLRRLRALPVHVWIWLTLFFVAGAIDLAYHAYGLVAGGDWLIVALGGSESTAFTVDLLESLLHGIVAVGLIGLILTALSDRLAQDERRQEERERDEDVKT